MNKVLWSNFKLIRLAGDILNYGISNKLQQRIKLIIVVRRLTTEIRSEKCVVSRFRRRANVIECESHRCTVRFVKSLQLLTNKCTYITFT